MWTWTKRVKTNAVQEWEARLGEDANLVVETLPDRRSVRMRRYCSGRAEAEGLRSRFGGEIREMRTDDWSAPPPAPPPVKIRDRLVLTAESDPREIQCLEREFSDRIVLSVPRDMAFGTGDHATTATCLRMLADIASERQWAGNKKLSDSPRGPSAVADLGCGTGVLAIAARRLGADHVWACDFDPLAVKVARRNVERNRAEGVEVEPCDVLRWDPPRRYDVVLANLFSSILIKAMPTLARALAPGGDLVVSGILHTQALEVFAAAAVQGIGFRKIVRRGKWIGARGGFVV